MSQTQPPSGPSQADSVPATPDEQYDSNPTSPGSEAHIDDDSGASTPLDPPSPSVIPKRVPSLRTVSDPETAAAMSSASTVVGALNNARRPPPSASNLPIDLMARARALQSSRLGRPSMQGFASTGSNLSSMGSPMSPMSGAQSPPTMGPGGLPTNMRLPPNMAANLGSMSLGGRPLPPGFPKSAPIVPSARKAPPSLSERRQMRLGGLPGAVGGGPLGAPKLSDLSGANGPAGGADGESAKSQGPPKDGGIKDSKMNDFRRYIDTEKGWITFEGAATITRTGVNFASGQTFSISLDEIQVLDELGKGNYGTVFKVRHAKPRAPRFGQGLSGFKPSAPSRQSSALSTASDGGRSADSDGTNAVDGGSATSGVVMAMKELRLELDEAKFTTILKELVILHECVSPYIIDFYGAFFQEGAVYMCIEYMDGGSIDKLYGGGIPESVIRKITHSTVMGLKSLKDDHNIIHRDVKPTNILVNTRGQTKICDFGVSGNLVASIAKTNIGCQSYMAPERISGGSFAPGAHSSDGTYSVQSDIWSLGLTVIECAMGKYPYPPEVSSTIFSQLSAIVEGDPPDLPAEGYSATARDFVRSCLNKNPRKRHTYPMLLAHPWLMPLAQPTTITEEAEDEDGSGVAEAASKISLTDPLTGCDEEVAKWVRDALDRKIRGDLPKSDKPALHAAPLDTVSPATSPAVGTELGHGGPR
ncbi:STE/STE7 protein kinase [Gaeumannomyces tritici R3-111a-1]|uniref:mitogen-activated protein kinase kinase n=1 Tax=Gaeumannomyces tritici (strain R3-111a-1) TaxID=644352 RepID=J3PF21_GAET3|nr:STE/STE7 protein kinase [Gaeumannomyces tritici R3-111a-1]EJT71079.1 STE/STE7 protein kinase [Gaeumannomyces tritici R3-111a-1]